jgi:[CysO sulfur-carrier protein]-S-L-cysteine hydrolase
MIFKFTQVQLGLKIQISQDILLGIFKSISHHFPKEFGGILLGEYSLDKHIVNISESICPNKFHSSPVAFTRNSVHLNMEIKKRFEASSGRVIYVGEWHSHPNGSTEFSKLDLKTMQSIGSNKNVMITMPILLIVGFNNELFDASFYVLHKQNLLKYEPNYTC